MYYSNPVFFLADLILELYFYVVIAAVIYSWFESFGIVNSQHAWVQRIGHSLGLLTEPVFSRVRSVLPAFGPLDFSPVVVILAIYFLRASLLPWLYHSV